MPEQTNGKPDISNHQSRIRKKHRIRSVISFILTYLLTLVLFAIFLIIGVNVGVFNDSVILNRLEKSNYYQSIHTTITNNVESIILSTGMDTSVLEGVITMDRVYIGAKNRIEAAIKGKSITQDTKELQDTLHENIIRYAQEHNLEVGLEQEKDIAMLSESVVKEFEKMMDFPFVTYYAKYKRMYQQIFWIAIVTLVSLSGAMSAILLSMYRFKHQGLRYVAYSMMSAVLMVIIVPFILLITRTYSKLNISPKYFYNFLVSYLKWDIEVFLYLGAIGLLIFAGLVLLIREMKKQRY